MLLYSLLHLSGYDLPLDQLRCHRRLHSLTPGHPEYGRTPGVETTAGPLGQGFANAVGLALAEVMLGQPSTGRATLWWTTSPTVYRATATWKQASRMRRRRWPGT